MEVATLGAFLRAVLTQEPVPAFPALPYVVLAFVESFADLGTNIATGLDGNPRGPGWSEVPVRLEASILHDGETLDHGIYEARLATSWTNHFHQITRSSQFTYMGWNRNFGERKPAR